MPLSLTVTQAKIDLNTHAEAAAKAAIERFAEDLFAEAGRLEAAQNTSGTPEITSTMIQDADIQLRRTYARPRKSLGTKAVHITSAVGGVLTGILADPELLKNTLLLITLVLVAVTTITATVVAILKD